jgi:hypothetical protein
MLKQDRHFLDLQVVSASVIATDIRVVDFPVYGLGLHGGCSPATLMLVAKREDESRLRSSMPTAALLAKSFQVRDAFKSPIVAWLAPGDVVTFDEPMDGCLLYHCEWPGDYLWDLLATDINTYGKGYWVGYPRRTTPYVRVFTRPGQVPSSLNYHKIPLSVRIPSASVETSEPVNVDETHGPGIVVPPNANWMTMHVEDDQLSPAQRIQAGESAVFNLWWQPAGQLLWCLNPVDSWAAGYREQASPTHDIETYELGRLAQRVCPQKVSGDAMNVRLTFGE